MEIKFCHFFTAVALFLFSHQALFSQETEVIYLSGKDASETVEWDFFCTEGRNSGKWTKIPVPSNWELQGFGVYNYGHDWANKERVLGKEHGLYKHSFFVPNEWKGKVVQLVFDGVMTDTRVKINGVPAGEMHQGGFYRFRYNVTSLLQYGVENLLEVDVAKHSSDASVNRAEREADFWIFGGIYRPVFLEVLPAAHLERVAIDPRADGSFQMLVNINKPGADYTVCIDLYDLQGHKIGDKVVSRISKGETKLTVSGEYGDIKAWNPEWPTLYNMKVSLHEAGELVHQRTERIGFRTVELRAHDGFYINGEKVLFKGVNRHSFWPETGRALSEANHIQDIELMKEMNMNAVRCSHYPPDKRFLELCDSMGLFVLNEVAGWQQGYDTIVGPKLIRETILRDENHPSVVIWDHGNEGGWDFRNEKYFHEYDIQKRPVIYPWLLRNGVDTHHYPEFDYAIARFVHGNDPFMPTELLHGLYDGGHGAGLEDYWRNYQRSPLHAGGFLWVFADEAVRRTDKEGVVYDGDGNHAPDGILGPHREKEGSFYTVKEIWSPVQVEPVVINKRWNGKLFLSNRFIYTNLKQCSFNWELVKTGFPGKDETCVAKGELTSPDAKPGETVEVHVDCTKQLQEADLFRFTAVDPHGNELYTWSWVLVQPEEKAKELLAMEEAVEGDLRVVEGEGNVTVSVNGVQVTFNTGDGKLMEVKNVSGPISFTGGPVVTGAESQVVGTRWEINQAGEFELEVSTKGYPRKIKWLLKKSGLLKLEVDSPRDLVVNADWLGISFNYPEEKCKGIRWMGKGPYRVWKNRLKGSNLGVWEKKYNHTITGESFGELIYPEFKGYHGNLFWAVLETEESPITVISETPNLYFQLFKPGRPKHVAGGSFPEFPEGDISFLYEIPAIGTKFYKTDRLGPDAMKGFFFERRGDEMYPIILWFDFRGQQ